MAGLALVVPLMLCFLLWFKVFNSFEPSIGAPFESSLEYLRELAPLEFPRGYVR